jgi:hypothetical protein
MLRTLSPLAWLRSAVKTAVLAGVADAFAELDPGDAHTAAARLGCLAAPQMHAEALGQPSPLPAGPDAAETTPDAAKVKRRNREP